MTIRGATILEASHIDFHHHELHNQSHGGHINNNESFEVDFDSADFDDVHINEGFRPDFYHDF